MKKSQLVGISFHHGKNASEKFFVFPYNIVWALPGRLVKLGTGHCLFVIIAWGEGIML